MITYLLVEETVITYGQEHLSYGVKVVRDRRCLRVIRDITDDKERLSCLINDMNELSLDPIHLDEVIEEFLND
ncbi:MAG: hypothetical protein IJH32_11200 [Ruminococcus sp.]|nr:hypothetical protein [Ruminococcus sp.]